MDYIIVNDIGNLSCVQKYLNIETCIKYTHFSTKNRITLVYLTNVIINQPYVWIKILS